MMYNKNRKQTLADRGLFSSEKAIAARLHACTGKRACSGRYPATVSPSVLTGILDTYESKQTKMEVRPGKLALLTWS